MAVLNHLSVSAAPEDIISELEKHGAVIVDEFLSKNTLERFNQEIQPHLERQVTGQECVNEGVTAFHGSQTRHLTGLAGVSNVFVNEVLLHPIFKIVADHFLLPSCSAYQLNIGHVIDRGPGAGDQFLHRDHDVWPRRMTDTFPTTQFASMTALGEYTAEMGATRIVPGSHKWDRDREPNPDEVAVAEMAPGSVAMYLGATLHAAGPNTTEKHRHGMHTSFCLGWLRTEENMNLSTPLERLRLMPREAQELLAFGIHDGIALGEGFLGAVDNSNPIDLIASGRL